MARLVRYVLCHGMVWLSCAGAVVIRNSYQPQPHQAAALAFVKNPETHLTYATYFSRQWLETFNFSLHNFLNTVFQNMGMLLGSACLCPQCPPALPTLLSFEDQNVRLRSLEEELRTLKRSAAYYEVPKYPRSPQESKYDLLSCVVVHMAAV